MDRLCMWMHAAPTLAGKTSNAPQKNFSNMTNHEQHKEELKKREPWLWVGLFLVLTFVFVVKKPPLTASSSVAAPRPVVLMQAPDPNWQEMVGALNVVMKKYDGRVGIYLKNLKTGQTFEQNADDEFVTASLIKVPIMAAVFQAIHDNRFSLDSTMILRQRHIRGGSGDLQYARLGRRFHLSKVLYKMITRSDNTACQMFIDLLGYDYLNQKFGEFGLKTTRIASTGMSLAAHLDSVYDNHTTPREMAMLLEKIYRHQLVSDGSSDLMIEIMKHAEGRSRLAKFLPKKWVLARKGGLLRKNLHDCGIVYTPKTDFIICVMTQENKTYRKAKSLIANIGQTTYTYLSRT